MVEQTPRDQIPPKEQRTTESTHVFFFFFILNRIFLNSLIVENIYS